jgi:hypothetical protein
LIFKGYSWLFVTVFMRENVNAADPGSMDTKLTESPIVHVSGTLI